jgi:hypothetical protein
LENYSKQRAFRPRNKEKRGISSFSLYYGCSVVRVQECGSVANVVIDDLSSIGDDVRAKLGGCHTLVCILAPVVICKKRQEAKKIKFSLLFKTK